MEQTSELRPSIFSDNNLEDRTAYFTRVEQGIMEPLRAQYPHVRFCFDFSRKAGLGYYPHLCFHIFATTQKGDIIQLADGGAVDWATKLLGNKREAMVASGIGAELMQKLLRTT